MGRPTDLLLGEARVDDVVDAIDGERGLGNVRRDDDLARAGRRRVEDARLHDRAVLFQNPDTL